MDVAKELLEMLRYIASGLSFRSPPAGGSRNPSQKNRKGSLRVGRDDNYIIYQGTKVSLAKWEKLTVAQAFYKYAGISEDALFNQNKFLKRAEEKGYCVKGFTYEDIFSQIYTN